MHYALAPYGVLANLLAMPVVSAWVMPMGILGVLDHAVRTRCGVLAANGLRHRLDGSPSRCGWRSLPGAFGRVHAFGAGPLFLASAGLLLMGLLQTPLRWSGASRGCRNPVGGDARRAPDRVGRRPTGADLRRYAAPTAGSPSIIPAATLCDPRMARGRCRRPRCPRSRLGRGISCDPSGCIGKLADGGLVAYALEPDAFEDDCAPRRAHRRGA